jgi:hypothetical protein
VLAGHEYLRGALPRHLTQGQQLEFVCLIRGLQALGLGRDVPQLQVLVLGAQGPRKRVLRRMIEDQQSQPPREPQATGLTLAERVLEESGRPQTGGLERDNARDRQQPARVVFACEALESAGKEQHRQDIVRWLGHRGDGPVVSHSGGMSARSVLRIRCLAGPRRRYP